MRIFNVTFSLQTLPASAANSLALSGHLNALQLVPSGMDKIVAESASVRGANVETLNHLVGLGVEPHLEADEILTRAALELPDETVSDSSRLAKRTSRRRRVRLTPRKKPTREYLLLCHSTYRYPLRFESFGDNLNLLSATGLQAACLETVPDYETAIYFDREAGNDAVGITVQGRPGWLGVKGGEIYFRLLDPRIDYTGLTTCDEFLKAEMQKRLD